MPFARFTLGEASGQARYLLSWLEDQDVSYVMAIRRSDTLTTSAGGCADRGHVVPGLAAAVNRSRGARPAGVRLGADPGPARGWRGRGHWLWPRRSLTDPAEIAYYACYGPAGPAWPTWPGSPGAAGEPIDAGFGEAARSISSRRFPASLAMSHQGVAIEEIARLVGHATTRTTEIVYRRELRPVITTGTEIMDQLFGGS